MGTISSKTRSINEDSKSVSELLTAAYNGHWDIVWNILGTPEKPKKAYLINCVPEDRRWGILHQAIYYFDCDVAQTLLKFKTCDILIRTKEGKCEAGDSSGKTPQELANDFGYTEMAEILRLHIVECPGQPLPTIHTLGKTIEDEQLGLFRITVAAYKKAFHPSAIDKSKPIFSLLHDIFKYVDTAGNWKVVRDRIYQPLFQICQPASSKVQKCETKKDFYSTIVNVYTNEDTQLYTYVNTALRRQRDSDYRPTADDLALGPYILMFHLLLMYGNLPKEKFNTFRRMNMSEDEIQQYKPGLKFTWLAFVSSSLNSEYAAAFPTVEPRRNQDHCVVFEIDNTTDTPWQPRDIGNCAEYTELERIYPACAEFIVQKTGFEDGAHKIYLKLSTKNG